MGLASGNKYLAKNNKPSDRGKWEILDRQNPVGPLGEREAITIANAAGRLLPGAVRGAQFHPRSRPLRHLSTLAD